MKRYLKWAGVIFLALIAILALLSYRPAPAKIEYGVSFSTLFAQQLGLDWKKVYLATLDDLGVRKLRLAAYWPMIEPSRATYDYSVMDFQVHEASKRNASIILAIGRRLPRWPECHVPEWAHPLSWEELSQKFRDCASVVLPGERVEKTIEMIAGLDELADVRELVELLST